jgi:hypothetical protein
LSTHRPRSASYSRGDVVRIGSRAPETIASPGEQGTLPATPDTSAVFSGALSVPPILIGRLKNELLAAERRVRLQAWQLEQLVSER